MSNNNGDLLDEDLQSLMGKDRCQNEWKPSKKVEEVNKEKKDVRKDKAIEAQWEPIKERTWMDNLKDCVQWVMGFGGLSFLLFYWEQAGLMAESIAVPCMCLCTALAGWGLGKNVRCK